MDHGQQSINNTISSQAQQRFRNATDVCVTRPANGNYTVSRGGNVTLYINAAKFQALSQSDSSVTKQKTLSGTTASSCTPAFKAEALREHSNRQNEQISQAELKDRIVEQQVKGLRGDLLLSRAMVSIPLVPQQGYYRQDGLPGGDDLHEEQSDSSEEERGSPSSDSSSTTCCPPSSPPYTPPSPPSRFPSPTLLSNDARVAPPQRRLLAMIAYFLYHGDDDDADSVNWDALDSDVPNEMTDADSVVDYDAMDSSLPNEEDDEVDNGESNNDAASPPISPRTRQPELLPEPVAESESESESELSPGGSTPEPQQARPHDV
ncbi:Uu.00g134410.m01.CDS01 [Anthostomella pinea]|uniref:Uu.00g134410.m01.CDS01 n=1 Tax=Anthostomella pinea TaxID=933095 RepID=A0AAI8YKS9_9PEZI|nr:Uu.00g134410.m01.CDS01 [Anthostomella pinea]